MQQTILTSVPLSELQTAISEAVRTEFLNFNRIVPPEPPEYITRKETGQILGVSLVTLNVWTKEGTLQGYRIGSRVRYKRNEVLNAVSKMKTGRAII